MRVVARCRMDLPLPPGLLENLAGPQRACRRETLALLTGLDIAEDIVPPVPHRVVVPGWNPDRAAEVRGQVRVAAAMIRMEVRVDDQAQGLIWPQGLFDQGQ